ncbi:uncharacterized protein LOC116263957 [Nymphaea colorata]|nr:uncharacterized protein LOC116263957 [Nymphaea colorata]
MDVIKFERRHKKKKVDGSTQPAFTPKQLDFPWFKKTYRRRKKEHGGGDSRKGTGGSDGLHLLAKAAADESFGGPKARSSSLSAGQVGNLSGKGVPTPAVLPGDRVVGFPQADPAKSPRVLNLHDSVNGKLMEKLKQYLGEHDVELGHGWKVRHKTCGGHETHSYLSPMGKRFTSMSSVLDHLREWNDGRQSTGSGSDLAKMKELNQFSISACPHPNPLVAKRVNPPASAKRLDDDNGDNKKHHVHHQEANAENIVLRERNGFLEPGKWVNQLLDGSHQLLHQEQSDTCGSLKAYTFGEHVMEDDADKFLICHGCKAAYHLHCLPSKVKDMPSGNWYCTSCTAAVKESTEPKPADVQSGDECACNHDPCPPCERLDHLVPPRTHGQGEHHCVVCRKLCKLRRPKHKQIKHHCFVCKRLYKLILAKHMHMQAKRKRSEAAATMPKTNAEDLDCHEDGQKSGVCKVCGTGKEGDEGIATCSNTYCESMHYHISCLKPPLKEVPPPGWYCHSCLCRACLIDENDDRIVICDGCDDGYHTYCMNPSLLRIPRGKWYCRSCQQKKAHPKIQPLPGS